MSNARAPENPTTEPGTTEPNDVDAADGTSGSNGPSGAGGDGPTTWRFPRSFWTANAAELFERAAYYGVFIGLAVYLSREYGFTDVGAGWAGGYFAGIIYLLPVFAGAWADRIGFRRALSLAFFLLTLGYLMLGGFSSGTAHSALGDTGIQAGAILGLTVIALGGAFVKSVISGTVAKSSDEANRARAFSIFYLVVNVGAFLGKTVAKPLRTELGLQYVSYYAAAMAFCGLITVLLLYRGVDDTGEGKSMQEILHAFGRVLTNTRFILLMCIVAGFWTIQGQLYAAMPKYVLRTVGEGASPEWLANINPLVVMLCVTPITYLVRKLRPVSSIGIALLIIPLSALSIALSPLLQDAVGSSVNLVGIAFHPITIAVIVGIAFQGLSECFLSPRYLEYASKQAPKGEEGLYMGFSHLHTVIAWPLGFILSGYLLQSYCPDPKSLSDAEYAQWQHAIETGGTLPDAYAHAHYLWYVFVGIGILSFVLLMVYRYVTDLLDRRGAGASESPDNG